MTSDHHHSSTPPQLEYDNYGLTYDPDNDVVLPYAEEDVVTIGSSGGLEYDHNILDSVGSDCEECVGSDCDYSMGSDCTA